MWPRFTLMEREGVPSLYLARCGYRLPRELVVNEAWIIWARLWYSRRFASAQGGWVLRRILTLTQQLHPRKPADVGFRQTDNCRDVRTGTSAISGGIRWRSPSHDPPSQVPRAGLHHPELRVSAPYDNTTCRSRPGVPKLE